MHLRLRVIAVCAIMMTGLTACSLPGDPTPEPPSTSASPSVEGHESAPASPIAFGTHVPSGAVQLGPLIRWRSAELIDTYTPDLEAIEAEKEAELQREIEEKIAEDPSFTPPTPTPTPTTAFQPERDSFASLEEIPRSDTFVSVMRIDGSPTQVVRSMLAQVSALLPDANLVTDNLETYCQARNRRVQACELSASGLTPGGRELAVTLTVDPGDAQERIGRAASRQLPVMVLQIQQKGDPREAQSMRKPESLGAFPDVTKTSEKSGWIWPKMDEDAPLDEPVLADWTPPSSVGVLLTGKKPGFVVVTTPRASIAQDVSSEFMDSTLGAGNAKLDVMADLNENITNFYGTNKKGERIHAIHIASARGNFVALFTLPPAR